MLNGNKLFFALTLLVGMSLAGCGGTGSGTGITNSVFQGSYTGTWTNTTSGANGPATIAVSVQGNFTGTFHDNVSNTDETVDTVIDNLGNVSGTIIVPGPTALTLSGTLALNATQLSGTLTESSGGTTVGSLTVSLTKQ